MHPRRWEQVPRKINRFLRLPVQRMNQSSRGGRRGVLFLSRKPQILTSDDYIQILNEKEAERKRDEELAEQKKNK